MALALAGLAGAQEPKTDAKKDPATMTLDELIAAGLCPVKREPFKLIYHASVDGKKYNFCCSTCRQAFVKEPAKYGSGGGAAKADTAAPKADVQAKKDDAKFSKEDEEFFRAKVYPVLSANCFECHADKKQKGELRLDSREAVLKGSENGVVVVPKDVKKSKLIDGVKRTTDDFAMPPKKALKKEEVEILVKWVELGVPWAEVKKEK
jgi:YHS domain-containing protein